MLANGVRGLLTIPLVAALTLPTVAYAQADTGSPNLAQATTVGIHNTYDPSAYPYLADALDSGAALIELDTWVDPFTTEWKVSHSDPLGNDNNCVAATKPAELYTGGANKDLGDCLDDIRIWLAAHPGHPPIMIKLEMKAGFDATDGLGPAQLDALIKQHLGDDVFRPADLLAKPGGGSYPDLDTAAKANNWPSRASLAGKVIIEAIPGTFEENNPFDHLWTDVEYARYLKDNTGTAEIFPSVLGAATGDPRTRYTDTTLRPWFVVFDGDASTYVTSVNTAWYDTNHYLLVMTDAQNVSPAINDTNPTVAQAQARVAQLAADHASVVSCDWHTLTTVLPEVLPRG